MIYTRSGDRGHNAKMWQIAINKIRPSYMTPLVEDGIFGSKTLSATIAIQRGLAVTPDGIVGDQTLSAAKNQYPQIIPIGFKTGMTAMTAAVATKTVSTTSAVQEHQRRLALKRKLIALKRSGQPIPPEYQKYFKDRTPAAGIALAAGAQPKTGAGGLIIPAAAIAALTLMK